MPVDGVVVNGAVLPFVAWSEDVGETGIVEVVEPLGASLFESQQLSGGSVADGSHYGHLKADDQHGRGEQIFGAVLVLDPAE